MAPKTMPDPATPSNMPAGTGAIAGDDLPATVGSAPELGFEGGQPTNLGGALFLINLLIHLGIPELFAPAWPLGSAVGAWGLLELFARCLLANPAAHADDPLWAALTRLDGRPPGVAPGTWLRLRRLAQRPRAQRICRPRLAAVARDYRIPAAWLRGLPDDPAARVLWAASGRHLRIWSSRGYVLFDGHVRRPDQAAASALLADLGLAGHSLARSKSGRLAAVYQLPAVEGVPAWIRRWLALTLPYARLRLALALGRDPAAALDELLAQRGMLSVSATHVDLALSLESTSIAVRLAGLDRNPGWIAEYGRVVLFHFVAPGEQEGV